MLAKVIIENGVKKIQALTADTGTGAPVGSYLYLEKKSNPQGYLYCDGSTFDETVYPALYQYLGTNVLPDWRELGAKGAEKNTTLIFDSTETDPRTGQAGTQNHDVFTQGEFKDDQLQNHVHGNEFDGNAICGDGNYGTGSDNLPKTHGVSNARVGTVTRGKSRAVFIYIKATSGLTENQQENVLNTINENNSYSTEEHPTGKKWIDGKPIYRKSFSASGISSQVIILSTELNKTTITPIKAYGFGENSANGDLLCVGYGNGANVLVNNTHLQFGGDYIFSAYNITIEYTKTTDN